MQRNGNIRQCALNKDRYIIHRAITVQGHPTTQNNQTRSKNKTNKNKQTKHNPKTVRPVISRSVHGHLKRIKRDDTGPPFANVFTAPK